MISGALKSTENTIFAEQQKRGADVWSGSSSTRQGRSDVLITPDRVHGKGHMRITRSTSWATIPIVRLQAMPSLISLTNILIKSDHTA